MRVASTPQPLIHAAFSRHAVVYPDAAALIHDGVEISYRALDAASDAYAAELSTRGVAAGAIVPLVLPSSPQLVAFQLAVLKCGAAYSNIDADWPPARQSAIFQQIAPEVAVALPQGRPPGDLNTFYVGLEDVRNTASRTVSFAPAVVDAADPATVFFTSGTTGSPKGVVVPHQAVTRLFGVGGLPGFGPGHVTPQAAAVAWDMYAFELWGQLCSGGAVATVPRGYLLPSTLRRLIRTAGVDTVWLTTSLFNLFVDEDIDCFEGLGQLFIGGEKLSPGHVRSFLSRHPAVPLRNGYGPAENCMLTTTRLISPADCDISGGIPVGRTVPGTTVTLLSKEALPCAPGETGEICIAGSGLAIGYLGQPEMTAQRFPTLAIGGTPVRVYRSGDMGVLDHEGVLHFHGRQDRQVKISGHRIELSEIEVVAREITGVRECLVVPLTTLDRRVTGLALCYVADPAASGDQPALAESELRDALARMLPPYLVPGVVHRFNHFPVTANGKADQGEMARIATVSRRSA